jgi:orotate phosphoribosyltransferase/AMMECR1 domain-containing protein
VTITKQHDAGSRIDRESLLERLRERGILYRSDDADVVGRDGKPSAWMLYTWPVLMTSDGLRCAAGELLELLSSFEATQIAGFGHAGISLMAACIAIAGGRYSGMAVRPEFKKYGAQRQIDPTGDHSSKVVVVDDSISSGTSLFKAIGILEREGYEVEGAVCLVDFSYRGGRERAEAFGYRIETVFDMWKEIKGAGGQPTPLYLRGLPTSWSAARAPEGCHPATVARHVAQHFLETGEVLEPPSAFDRNDDGRGGVWVSLRRRSDDVRLARQGFWHFQPDDADPTRDVVLATIATVKSCKPPLTPSLLSQLKIAVSFFTPLERIAPADLDFRRYGIVVRSVAFPYKLGGALPNTQLYTSTFEQYRHAREINAKIGAHEPHEVFRHDVLKRAEPGERWPAYGEDERLTDGWSEADGIGDALTARASAIVDAVVEGHPIPEEPIPDGLVPEGVRVVAVSLYDRGLVGRVITAANRLDDAIVAASIRAVDDARFGAHRDQARRPAAVVVSLLHDPEEQGTRTAAWVSWRFRAGRDSVIARQGRRLAVTFETDLVHNCWTKRQMTDAVLKKAGIKSGPVSWTTYKTTSWLQDRAGSHRLEFGAVRREPAPLTDSDVYLMGDYLYRGLDLNGWPAYQAVPATGRYERAGAAPRCLQGLHALYEAGVSCSQVHWRGAAQRGLAYALGCLRPDVPTLSIPNHGCGPIADACLLHAVSVAYDSSLLTAATQNLARRLRSWITKDGMVLPEGFTRCASDHDFIPGVALLALARYADKTGDGLAIDWRAVRTWYQRRFRRIHAWGLALWHSVIWPVVATLTNDRADADFAFEIVDWMSGQQLNADGTFLTNLTSTGASFHTACAARGVAGAWQLALSVGDTDRSVRYRQMWQHAMTFINRLVVRPEDGFWMPEPAIVIGGVRKELTSYELRVDQTAYTILALVTGLRAEESMVAVEPSPPARAPTQCAGRTVGSDGALLVLGADVARPELGNGRDESARPSEKPSGGIPDVHSAPKASRDDVGIDFLTERAAVRLLLDLGLLSVADIVAGQLIIHRIERRNHNFRVQLADGSGFSIKQARTPSSAITVRNEALLLASGAEKRINELGAHTPRICHYDPIHNVLVTELIPGRTLGLGPAPLHEINRRHMEALGQALAMIHRAVPPSGIRAEHQVPLGVSLSRPSLDLYRDSSGANIQLLAAIQSNERLCDHLSNLDGSWESSGLIHGDVKLDNIVACDDERRGAIALVDWELAGSGDPRWDVGSALGELLHMWLVDTVSRELEASASPDKERSGAPALEQIRALSTALLESYHRHALEGNDKDFANECFGFSAARLLQTAYETHYSRRELDLYAVKAVQMAANIAAHRDGVAGLFLGHGAVS